jgi:hypothetical protein
MEAVLTNPVGGDAMAKRWAAALMLLGFIGIGSAVQNQVLSQTDATAEATSAALHANQTVFVIVMENKNWSQIKGSPDAPYINSLLPMAAHAEAYYTPPGNHPSETNYLWMEAGMNFGIHNDKDPEDNHQGTTDHLVSLLEQVGISWRSYQENISGKDCPLENDDRYAVRHNPMVYFDDVTDSNDRRSTHCIQHVRPYDELAGDLVDNSVARYNFITPNLCHDMHNFLGCASLNEVKNGDDWLAGQLPAILDSQAYQDGGVVFLTWDEGADNSDGPIGMIVLSPNAKGGGYSNTIRYTHSSLLRTLQEIFGVTPYLGDAADAPDLSDLFARFP